MIGWQEADYTTFPPFFAQAHDYCCLCEDVVVSMLYCRSNFVSLATPFLTIDSLPFAAGGENSSLDLSHWRWDGKVVILASFRFQNSTLSAGKQSVNGHHPVVLSDHCQGNLRVFEYICIGVRARNDINSDSGQ